MPEPALVKTKTKSVNASILRAILRHRTRLIMLENGVASKVQRILRPTLVKLMADLGVMFKKRLKEAKLWKSYIWYEAEETVAPALMASNRAKQIADEIIRELKRRFEEPLADIDDILASSLNDIGAGEVEIVSGILRKYLHDGTLQSANITVTDEIPAATITKFVTTKLGGETFSDRLEARYGESLVKIRKGIFAGLVQGEGVDSITRSIAVELATVLPNAIERIVRTEIMRVANDSLRELYSKNTDIIKKVQFVATLDWRTCLVCGQYDGHVYNVDDAPDLPIHPRCRCLLVPVVKSWWELGADRNDVPDSVRASMNGTVPASTAFMDFFQDQGEDFQRQVLGDTKYDLWSSGRISLDQITTRQRIRTVAELLALSNE